MSTSRKKLNHKSLRWRHCRNQVMRTKSALRMMMPLKTTTSNTYPFRSASLTLRHSFFRKEFHCRMLMSRWLPISTSWRVRKPKGEARARCPCQHTSSKCSRSIVPRNNQLMRVISIAQSSVKALARRRAVATHLLSSTFLCVLKSILT